MRLSQSEGDGKLQAAEVNVAGRADKASAAALGIEDSRITVHCGLGSEASGKEMSLSPPEGDGKLQAPEVNVAGRADKASAAALGIGDSRSTVHCGLVSEASGKEVRLSPSEGDGKLQATEVHVAGRADEK